MPTKARKCLEVQLTTNIDWGTHVQPFEPRPIGHSDYSDAISHCFPFIKEIAVKALVRTQMEYCISEWNPNEKGDVATPEKVQCRAAHFVKNDFRRKSRVLEMIKDLL